MKGPVLIDIENKSVHPVICGLLVVVFQKLKEKSLWAEIAPMDADLEILTTNGNVKEIAMIVKELFNSVKLPSLIQVQRLGECMSAMLVTTTPDD